MDPAREVVRAAVGAIEGRTAAELVVAVQRRSQLHALPSAILGVLAAIAVQAFLLFSEPEFPLDWFIVAPLSAGALAALFGRLAPIQRRLTPARMRRHGVLLAGQATFYRRQVGHTRDHTGVLVFLSITERQCEVVADTGLLRARPLEAWDAAVAGLDLAMARGGQVDAVVAALHGLGDVLARCLPRADDDAAELDDQVIDE